MRQTRMTDALLMLPNVPVRLLRAALASRVEVMAESELFHEIRGPLTKEARTDSKNTINGKFYR